MHIAKSICISTAKILRFNNRTKRPKGRIGKPQKIKGETKMDEYGFWHNSGRNLMNGFRLEKFYEYGEHKTCGAGDTVEWRIIDAEGHVIESGFTCPCCRGCGNKDDIDEVVMRYQMEE